MKGFKHFALLLLAVLTVGCASSVAPESAKRIAVLAESANGHEYHLLPIIEEGVSDVMIMMAFPSRWSFTEGRNQAAPFVGSDLIMNGQTQALKTQEIGELFTDKNARGVVFSRPDHVVAQLEFPIEHAAEVVPVATELLANSEFEPRWLERIKQNLVQRSEEMQALTIHRMFDVSRAAIIQNDSLEQGLSTAIAGELDALTQEDISQWHDATFTTHDVTISVAGAVTQEQAGEIVDTLLSGLPEGTDLPAIESPVDFTQRTVLLHLPDAEKTTLAFIGQLPETSPVGDMSDLILLGTYAEPSGPLFEALRTDLRATYGFQAGATNYDRGTRILFITGELDTEKLSQAVDVVLETYTDHRQGNTLAGWEGYKQRLVQGTTDNLKSVSAAALTMMELAIDGKDTQLAVGLPATINDITLSDLKSRLAQEYPAADELLIFAASADANALPGACVITSVEQIEQCNP